MRAILVLSGALLSQASTLHPPADPLTITIETADVDRFAEMFRRTKGNPTAEQVQRDYLDRGSYGVRVFTPQRIRSAANLAATIAAKPELYRKAITECLPIVKATTGELRATYLALSSLYPGLPLPRLYLVVGANNSGGTAGPGAQVLGLETLCRVAPTADKLRAVLRRFYAHETVHALQDLYPRSDAGGALLTSVLEEGAADFIAELATGHPADPDRAAWAAPREARLWHELKKDLALTHGMRSGNAPDPKTPMGAAYLRWIANYNSAPKGWPGELGYWMGQRIWQRWYDRQRDKRAALRQLLTLDDPEAVLAEGRFTGT